MLGMLITGGKGDSTGDGDTDIELDRDTLLSDLHVDTWTTYM